MFCVIIDTFLQSPEFCIYENWCDIHYANCTALDPVIFPFTKQRWPRVSQICIIVKRIYGACFTTACPYMSLTVASNRLRGGA